MTIANEVHELTATERVTAWQKCLIIILSWWMIFMTRYIKANSLHIQLEVLLNGIVCSSCTRWQPWHLALFWKFKTSLSSVVFFTITQYYIFPRVPLTEKTSHSCTKKILPNTRSLANVFKPHQHFFTFLKFIFNVFVVIKLTGVWVDLKKK